MSELPYACARIGCADRGLATSEVRCPSCGHETQSAQAQVHRRAQLGQRTLLVSDLVLVGGFGHGIPLGQPYDLFLTPSGVVLQTPQEHVYADHPFEDITLLHVSAPEMTHGDGDLLSGGLDIPGVPFLPLAGELLKVLVEPRAVKAVVQLAVRGREYTFTHETLTPQQTTIALAVLAGTLRDLRHDREAASRPALEAAPTDLVGQLSALATLRRDGFLTDAEFAAAKDKLLR